jgi:hypothetical protein
VLALLGFFLLERKVQIKYVDSGKPGDRWTPLARSSGKPIDTSKRKTFALAISARKTKKRILDWWTSLQAIRALFPFK